MKILGLVGVLLCIRFSAFAFEWRYEEAVRSTQSFKYKWLEIESAEQNEWLRRQNAATNTWLQSRSNKKAIEKWVRSTFDHERIYGTTVLKDGSSLFLRDNGLGKSTDLVWTSKSKDKQFVIYKNTAREKNKLVYFEGFLLSPDEKYLALKALRVGSIDYSDLLILELAPPSGAVLRGTISSRYNSRYAWTFKNNSPHIYISTGVRDGISVFNIRNLKSPVEKIAGDGVTAKDGWLLINRAIVGGESFASTLVRPNGEVLKFPEPIADFLGIVDGYIYYSAVSSERGMGKVSIKRASLNEITREFNIEVFAQVPSQIMTTSVAIKKNSKGKNQVVGLGYWGPSRKAFAFFLDKPTEVIELEAPRFADFATVELGENLSSNIAVKLTSYLNRNKDFSYDPLLKTFSPDPENLLKDSTGKRLISEVKKIKSFDGTEFDLRMTYFEGIKQDANNPVLIDVYGGFKSPSNFYPFFIGENDLRLKFLEKGGIMVGATVRGGNEYGDSWNAVARYANKPKTFEDTASIAKYLIDNQWTTASKVALAGGSNGGMVVAATGLLYGEYFGLVIPKVGVHDMIGKDDLDLDFVNGWTYEYLSGKTESGFKALLEQSPLELAVKGNRPNFLISGGRSDTRVHPSHSMKLTQALQDNPLDKGGYVRFFSPRFSGHFHYSTSYQDLIGWRVNVVYWIALFEQYGWDLP